MQNLFALRAIKNPGNSSIFAALLVFPGVFKKVEPRGVEPRHKAAKTRVFTAPSRSCGTILVQSCFYGRFMV